MVGDPKGSEPTEVLKPGGHLSNMSNHDNSLVGYSWLWTSPKAVSPDESKHASEVRSHT